VAFLKKSIRLFRAVGSVDGEAAAVSALSAASIEMGAPEHAAVHATEALALATSAGASETVAKSLCRLGAGVPLPRPLRGGSGLPAQGADLFRATGIVAR